MGDFYFESAMDRISDFMASNSTMPKDAYASIYNSRFRMNSGLRIIEHESIDDISDWDEQETIRDKYYGHSMMFNGHKVSSFKYSMMINGHEPGSFKLRRPRYGIPDRATGTSTIRNRTLSWNVMQGKMSFPSKINTNKGRSFKEFFN